jgi:hypothetical protein
MLNASSNVASSSCSYIHALKYERILGSLFLSSTFCMRDAPDSSSSCMGDAPDSSSSCMRDAPDSSSSCMEDTPDSSSSWFS